MVLIDVGGMGTWGFGRGMGAGRVRFCWGVTCMGKGRC